MTFRKRGFNLNMDEKSLQEQADSIVFAESEVTQGLKAACEEQGIKLNVVPDRQYEESVAMGFGEWLLKNYPPKKG